MATVDFRISLQLAHKPTEAGVQQLSDDMRRYLLHMLKVAKVDGAEIEKSDILIIQSARRKAGPSGISRRA